MDEDAAVQTRVLKVAWATLCCVGVDQRVAAWVAKKMRMQRCRLGYASYVGNFVL